MDDIRSLLQPAKAPREARPDDLPPVRRFADGSFPDEDYDRIVKELIYEKRSTPTDRLKTDEEIALDEKEKLEKLEKERLQRMHGLTAVANSNPSRPSQADDLEDGYNMESHGPQDMPLVYKDGLLQNSEIFFSEKSQTRKRKAETMEDQESEGESGSEEDSGEDSEDSEDESGSEEESTEPRISLDQDGLMDSEDDEAVSGNDSETNSETLEKEKEPFLVSQEAHQELPFTFDLPQSLDDFNTLVQGRSAQDISTIIHRLRVLYNRKLHFENKAKLEVYMHFRKHTDCLDYSYCPL